MKIVTNNTGSFAEWDNFVSEHEEATPFHWSAWMYILRESFCVTPYFLEARGENGVKGVLSLYGARSLLGGKELRSLPAAGILSCNKEEADCLCEEAINIRDRLGYPYVRIEGGLKPRKYENRCLVHERVTTVVSVDKGEEVLWKNLSSNTRRKVRKARRNGLDFTVNIQMVNEFYHIYAQNMHRLGTPVIGPCFFHKITEYLSEKIRLFIITTNSQVVGGMLCLIAGNVWRSLYVGMKTEVLPKYSTYLLYWMALKTAARERAKRFDLGTSIPGSGTHRFKQQWAGQDEHILNTYFFGPQVEKSLPKLEDEKAQNTWKKKLWQKIPLKFANIVGPILRKSLPFG